MSMGLCLYVLSAESDDVAEVVVVEVDAVGVVVNSEKSLKINNNK